MPRAQGCHVEEHGALRCCLQTSVPPSPPALPRLLCGHLATSTWDQPVPVTAEWGPQERAASLQWHLLQGETGLSSDTDARVLIPGPGY